MTTVAQFLADCCIAFVDKVLEIAYFIAKTF